MQSNPADLILLAAIDGQSTAQTNLNHAVTALAAANGHVAAANGHVRKLQEKLAVADDYAHQKQLNLDEKKKSLYKRMIDGEYDDEKPLHEAVLDAREELRLAEAKVGVADAQVGVAKMEVGVAEAKVGVAKAELSGDVAKMDKADQDKNEAKADLKQATNMLGQTEAKLVPVNSQVAKAKETLDQATKKVEAVMAGDRLPISSEEVKLSESKAPVGSDVEFMEPPQFKEQVKNLANMIGVDGPRSLASPVINGLMGVGKTRFGREVCTRVSRESDGHIKIGYVSSTSYIAANLGSGDQGDAYNAKCLAMALVQAFCHDVRLKTFTLSDVVAKFKEAYGSETVVLLHVDEYSRNLHVAEALLCGAAAALNVHHFKVIVILTGTLPAYDLDTSPAAAFMANAVTLEPLAATTEEIKISIMHALDIKLAPADMDYKFDMLVEMCDGYPASLVELISILGGKESPYINGLRAQGKFPVGAALDIYNKLLGKLQSRYGRERWLTIFYGGGAAVGDGNNNNDNNTGSTRVMSNNAKRLLLRVALVSMAHLPVKSKDLVLGADAEHSLVARNRFTYGTLQQRGLVNVTKGDDDKEYVWMPLMALCVINNDLKFVDWDMFDNPFDVNFDAHERLAVCSIALRIRALKEVSGGRGTPVPVASLRPGARMHVSPLENNKVAKKEDELLIYLPETVRCITVGSRFVDAPTVVTDSDSRGGTLTDCEDGAILLMGLNEPGVDGAAVFSGVQAGKPVLVLFLSQSKSTLTTTALDEYPVVTAVAAGIKALMTKAGQNLSTTWLQDRIKREPNASVVFVYDIFTDREMGARFNSENLLVAQSVAAAREVMFITPRDSLKTVVGPALHVRASLKRPADSPAAAELKKQKAEE